VQHLAQLADLHGRQLLPEQAQELGVAVLLDDVDAVVGVDELGDRVAERIRADAQVVGLELRFADELIAALLDRPVGGAVGDDPDPRALADVGPGTCRRAVSNFFVRRSRLRTKSSGRSL
jgi:hypothetical protein